MGKGRPGQRRKKHARGESTADELERSFGMSAGTKLQTYLIKIRPYADAAGYPRSVEEFLLEFYQPEYLSKLVKEETEDDIKKNASLIDKIIENIKSNPQALRDHVEKRKAEEEEKAKAEAPQLSGAAGGQSGPCLQCRGR